MNLILLGAPGAGKGTQAEKIVEKYNIPAISTGNIIRAAIKNSTEMGLKAKSFTESGQLVPDDVVIGIIKERLAENDCQAGFILDGFPRTIPQAQALKDMGVNIDKVINIEVDDETVINRISGRRVCAKCSNSYHLIYKKPKLDGVCDSCGGELVQRKDDESATVKARLDEYHRLTEPLKDFYSKEGILKTVYGQEKVSDTTALVFQAIDE
ncbi:MAG: adenylate kinase [Clostridiales bacterium]|nr:adenylate kinase [Clostridiales bacterium]